MVIFTKNHLPFHVITFQLFANDAFSIEIVNDVMDFKPDLLTAYLAFELIPQ